MLRKSWARLVHASPSYFPWLEETNFKKFFDPTRLRSRTDLIGSGFGSNLLQDMLEGEKRLAQLQADLKDKSIQDLKELINAEIETENSQMLSLSEKLRQLLLMEVDKRTSFFQEDKCDARIEVRAGVGGEEASMWASEIFNMYLDLCPKLGWHVEEDSSSDDELLKCSVTGSSSEQGPYGFLKFESGVHRVQRIPFNSDRMQTSAAAVYVIPKVDVPQVKIKESDLKVYISKKSSGAGGQSVNSAYQQVRMTHVPTGFTVVVNESHAQQENREIALEKVKSRVQQMEEEKILAAMAKCRKGQIKTADRSEKVRSYNFQRNQVSDHRLLLGGSCQDFLKEGSGLVSVWHALRERKDNELINEFLSSYF